MTSSRNLSKRLSELEAARPEGQPHYVCIHDGWCPELTVEHSFLAHEFHHNPVPRNAPIVFVRWTSPRGEDDPWPYPAGYFDDGGLWAKLCAERGIPHPDNLQ